MMKRVVVFLLLMLLLVSSVFSLDMLSAEFAVEIGWLPQGVFNMYTSREVFDLSNTFYTSMEAKVFLFEYVFVGGGIDTIIHKSAEGYSFVPDGNDYMFIAGIRVGIVEIFYQHNCLHPAPTYTYFRKFAPQWEAAYDRIGIRIEGKIK